MKYNTFVSVVWDIIPILKEFVPQQIVYKVVEYVMDLCIYVISVKLRQFVSIMFKTLEFK